MYGGQIIESVTTVQDGTDPVSDDDKNRGFCLVAPGGSKNYPLSRVTKWLRHNTTSNEMEAALRDTEGMPPGFTVT